MQKLFDFINKNKFLTVVLLVLAFIFTRLTNQMVGSNNLVAPMGITDFGTVPSTGMGRQMNLKYDAGAENAMYQTDDYGRRFIQDASMSLLVKDVDMTLKSIEEQARNFGGYTVNRHINTPEFGKTGYISVRVANEKRLEFVEFLKSQAIKVVSEDINGYDITEQYTDVEERLKQEEALKAKLMTIMNSANTVEEMIQVQNELTNVQMRIDSLKGQMKYMTDASATTLFTINVSTDELALPYTPANPFRPDVVFKQAVRSMIGTIYKIGSLAIWLAVYAVLLVPAWYIGKAVRRKLQKKTI